MTTKEKILSVIETLEDDTSIDQAIDRLYLLRKVEMGLQQANAGDLLEHDAFMQQLEDEEAKAAHASHSSVACRSPTHHQ